MTRSKLREHCFKMLFCADFYPAEEKEEQIDRYFDEPKEDETTPEGVDEILHDVEMSPEEPLCGRFRSWMRRSMLWPKDGRRREWARRS